MRLVGVLGVVLIGVGCGRNGSAPQLLEASARAAPAPTAAAPPDKDSANAIREQLDRIDRRFRTPASHPFAIDKGDKGIEKMLAAAKAHDEDVPKLRDLSRIDDPSMDPRGALAIIALFLEEQPRVSHKMIRKNPKKYSGWPIWLSNAKIVEVREEDQTTRAMVSYGGERFFVVSRFETPFVDEDAIDVVGFVGGEYDTGKITTPAIAAAAIMKGGSVAAMNKIMKWFGGM
jgi:hypothetical protein